MVNLIMVSKDFGNVNKTSNFDSKTKELTVKSRQESSPACTEQYSPASGMDCLRKNLLAEGISERVTELISN